MAPDQSVLTAQRRSAVAPPSTADLALIALGVLAVGSSAPLITATAAPALAIAFWRNALGSAALAPAALLRQGHELRRLPRRQLLLVVGSGVLLAAHFGTWVPSLSYTSVASSVALAATQPIWAATIARVRGHVVPTGAWLGIAVALAGVVLLTGIDRSLSARAAAGDVLALAGGIFVAGYMTVGSSVRQTVSTLSYAMLCYATCALVLLLVCIAAHVPLGGYEPDTWLKLLALTLTAQLIGHTIFNRVLSSTSPTVVSLAILFEVPAAALIAALWLGQRPPLAAIPALLLLLVGVGVVVWSSTTADAEAEASEPVA